MYHKSKKKSCKLNRAVCFRVNPSVAWPVIRERNTKPEYIGPRYNNSVHHRGQIVLRQYAREYSACERRCNERAYFLTANMYIYEKKIIFLFFLINYASRVSCLVDSSSSVSPTPVVLWHGMGDSCCFSFSLGQIKTILEEQLPGVYVKSIRIGNNVIEDVENSYLKNANHQVAQVCDELSKDEKLKDGYHAIGFSQGGQFLRAVAQRCPNPPMKNLISLGGQHQGVYGLPNCPIGEHRICDYMSRLINHAAYTEFVQEKLVQAEYWHDPLKELLYKKKSIFLADINNELFINETYKTNLQKLERLVLVKFEQDTMVQPRESEWFGFYKPGQAVELQTLQESALYREDRLGLREMDQMGKIYFLSLDANHLQFTDRWFIDKIIKVHL